MQYLRYVRISSKRFCKCRRITAPTEEIEWLFFLYLWTSRLSVALFVFNIAYFIRDFNILQFIIIS